MIYQEICNGKLVIIDPLLIPSFKTINGNKLNSIPKKLSYEAHIILEDMHDGTYTVLKNRNGKLLGAVVTQKAITKFMLRC